jgi:hypothetical protein
MGSSGCESPAPGGGSSGQCVGDRKLQTGVTLRLKGRGLESFGSRPVATARRDGPKLLARDTGPARPGHCSGRPVSAASSTPLRPHSVAADLILRCHSCRSGVGLLRSRASGQDQKEGKHRRHPEHVSERETSIEGEWGVPHDNPATTRAHRVVGTLRKPIELRLAGAPSDT